MIASSVVVLVVVVVVLAASMGSGQQTPGTKSVWKQTDCLRLLKLRVSVRQLIRFLHWPNFPSWVVHGRLGSMTTSTLAMSLASKS